MVTFFIQTYNFIKSNKYLKYLVPLLFVFLLLYFSFSKIRSAFSGLSDTINASGSSLSDENASAIVTRLIDNFNNLYPNSSSSEIIQLLSNISTSDYFKLKSFFGNKSRDLIGHVDESFSSFLFPEYNLTEWLSFELSIESISELKQANGIFNNIL